MVSIVHVNLPDNTTTDFAFSHDTPLTTVLETVSKAVPENALFMLERVCARADGVVEFGEVWEESKRSLADMVLDAVPTSHTIRVLVRVSDTPTLLLVRNNIAVGDIFGFVIPDDKLASYQYMEHEGEDMDINDDVWVSK
jgi:hypothetical protein